MPVNNQHDDVVKHAPQWRRVRDAVAGSDAVKQRGTAYLPKPGGHSADDYVQYTTRAEFYPATGRTLEGLVGAVFRKEPSITVPDGYERLTESFTVRGLDLTNFARDVLREVLIAGRYGVLVDVAVEGGDPFAAGYTAENIVNWRVSVIDRVPVVTMVVLREMATVDDPDDRFGNKTVERYRVLFLGRPDGDQETRPVYAQEVWEKIEGSGSAKGDEFALIRGPIIPTKRGEPLPYIPFTFFGPRDILPRVDKSPLLDLVDVNLSHYRTSAELEEGAYFTGLPMYVVAGRPQGEDTSEFVVGSRKALMLEAEGTAFVLQADGGAMGALQQLSEDKERRMAVLGARLLEGQTNVQEAAETVALRHSGEAATLSSTADATGRGLTQVLRRMVWWAGGPDVEAKDNMTKVSLNKDFVAGAMSPKELVEMAAAWQQGIIGDEAMFKALKEGERIPDGWTKKDWLEDIEYSSANGLGGLEEEDDEEPEENSSEPDRTQEQERETRAA